MDCTNCNQPESKLYRVHDILNMMSGPDNLCRTCYTMGMPIREGIKLWLTVILLVFIIGIIIYNR
jgi:hypothetical protein